MQNNLMNSVQPGGGMQQSMLLNQSSLPMAVPQGGGLSNSTPKPNAESAQVLDSLRLQNLVREVDPHEQLDEDVEEALLQLADDFIESIASSSCVLAKHRNSSTLEVKDVQLHLERQWNMWIPGFGCDDIKPFKKAPSTEAHKQRMALIRKTLKK